MALIEQWRSTRPWFVDGLAALAGGALGLGALFPFIAPAAQGTLATPRDHAWEHPLRKRILNTLERSPGIHYRELQRQLDAANGTLRHHLDVLIKERTVTISDTTYPLDSPFLVLATQNPIEQEGTYPLPEAQIDRFMLKLSVGYPTKDEEMEIMRRMSAGPAPEVSAVVEPDEILRAREAVQTIYMDPQVEQYIVELVFATREPKAHNLGDLADLIAFGASPRATISLAKAARAHAFLKRRGYVTPEDVRSIGLDVLRHRVILTYEAEAEEMTADDVVNRVLNSIEVP